MAPHRRPLFTPSPIVLSALLFGALAMAGPAEARDPAACQSPEETEAVAALAKAGIAQPGLALVGVGRAAADRGGEWLVAGWKPCPDAGREPESGTRVQLYHQPDDGPDGARASLVAETELAPELTYVTPAENPVLETADGPLVLLEAATGGNCMTCEQLLALRVDGAALRALTPPDPRVALREVTAVEPLPIITGYSAALESYGPLCHACSPSTTIHLRLEKGQLLENCTAARDDYLADAAASTAETAEQAAATETDDTAADDLLTAAISALLDRLNGGVKLPDALAAFDTLSSRAVARATPRHGEEIKAAGNALAEAVRKADAEGALKRGCPALGVTRPEGF